MKYRFLIPVMLLLLAVEAKGQLHFANPSFEPMGFVPDMRYVQYKLPGWTTCKQDIECADGIIDAFKWYDTSQYWIPTDRTASDGYYFLGLIARSYYFCAKTLTLLYPEAVQESVSTSLSCGRVKIGHRYKVSIDVRRDFDTHRGDPYFYLFGGNDSCTVSDTLFEHYVTDPAWQRMTCSFVAKSAWDHLSLRCRHMFKDSTTFKGRDPVWMYADNLSPVIPDTAYNSLYFPITVSNDGAGDYVLQSPYLDDDQNWYDDTKFLGRGRTISVAVSGTTVFTLTLGKDSCVASVLQTTVNVTPSSTPTPRGPLFPNAFSPDGKGDNDLFRAVQTPDLAQLRSYELSVFSRWGERIFTTNDYTRGWDGSNAGVGVYFWICRYTLQNGTQMLQKGDLSLVR